MHNLHSCSAELKASIDTHAATLAGWGVPRLAIDQSTEAAIIVASLTEDAVLGAALLAQAAFASEAEEAREIELHFGTEVSALARELAHFGDIRLTPVAATTHHLEPAQAEALRKMLLSVVSDPRLVLARLARQLVDLNASKDGHAATRSRLALETREVFAPLANRLGLWQLKWELEDLAFRFLQPDDYRRIASALAEKRTDRERYITELCRTLEDMLRGAGIDAEIYGRPKHIYSIHRKMERKQLSFEQVFDLRAVRIVTDTRGRLLRGARAGAWALQPTSRASSTTTSPRPRTISIAPFTPPSWGRRARPWRCRSARARCTTRPSWASRRIGDTKRGVQGIARPRRVLRPQDRVGTQAARTHRAGR